MTSCGIKFSRKERKAVGSFLEKAAIKRERDPQMRLIGFQSLFRLCSKQERALLKKFLKLDPRAYGFKGIYYGITATPKDMVTIRRERIPKTERYLSNGTHFLSRKAHEAYRRMNRAMLRDIGRRVFIFSGYRSPAYQLIVFLEILKEHKFNMKRAVKGVALPGYSEHGAAKQQAIDFTTRVLRGKATTNSAFERTKEYQWLKKYAHKFGFQLSYPRGNKQGVMFEPWHWHFADAIKIHNK